MRADGRPHATTIGGIWLDETFYFTTGPNEQKAINMASGHEHVVVVTGHNDWRGLDVVIEGEAMRVTDAERPSPRRASPPNTTTFRLRESEGRLIWVDGADDAIEGRKDALNDAACGLRGPREQGLRLRQGRHVQPDPLAVRRAARLAGAGSASGGRFWFHLIWRAPLLGEALQLVQAAIREDDG